MRNEAAVCCCSAHRPQRRSRPPSLEPGRWPAFHWRRWRWTGAARRSGRTASRGCRSTCVVNLLFLPFLPAWSFFYHHLKKRNSERQTFARFFQQHFSKISLNISICYLLKTPWKHKFSKRRRRTSRTNTFHFETTIGLRRFHDRYSEEWVRGTCWFFRATSAFSERHMRFRSETWIWLNLLESPLCLNTNCSRAQLALGDGVPILVLLPIDGPKMNALIGGPNPFSVAVRRNPRNSRCFTRTQHVFSFPPFFSSQDSTCMSGYL